MQAMLWHVGDARANVGELRFRVDVVETHRHDERGHHGSPLGATIRTGRTTMPFFPEQTARRSLRGSGFSWAQH